MSPPPRLIDAKVGQMRVRIVALDGLVIGLMAKASPQQSRVAERVARHSVPRPGFTSHPVTLKAAAEMRCPVRRARASSVIPDVAGCRLTLAALRLDGLFGIGIDLKP